MWGGHRSWESGRRPALWAAQTLPATGTEVSTTKKWLSLLKATSENKNMVCWRQRHVKIEGLLAPFKIFNLAHKLLSWLSIFWTDSWLLWRQTVKFVFHWSLLFLLAAKIVEKECNVSSTQEVIRISQCKCIATDRKQRKKVILEKKSELWNGTYCLLSFFFAYPRLLYFIFQKEKKYWALINWKLCLKLAFF